mgnify:CR=1 FL=1
MDATECGGAGTVGDASYFWMVDGDFISAGFDTGHSLFFENDAEGWGAFLAYAVVLGKLY